MPALRDVGPYIHPSWLPRILFGMDRCEWEAWFQAHHDGRTWQKLDSGLNQVRYNIIHTEIIRRCAEELELRGFAVAVEHQNDFKVTLQGATISGRPDRVATRNDEAVIVDAKAAQCGQAHEIQVMLYMMFLPLADRLYSDLKITVEVYYGHDRVLKA